MKLYSLPPDYSPEVVAEVRAAVVIDRDNPQCRLDTELRHAAWAVLRADRAARRPGPLGPRPGQRKAA